VVDICVLFIYIVNIWLFTNCFERYIFKYLFETILYSSYEVQSN